MTGSTSILGNPHLNMGYFMGHKQQMEKTEDRIWMISTIIQDSSANWELVDDYHWENTKRGFHENTQPAHGIQPRNMTFSFKGGKHWRPAETMIQQLDLREHLKSKPQFLPSTAGFQADFRMIQFKDYRDIWSCCKHDSDQDLARKARGWWLIIPET